MPGPTVSNIVHDKDRNITINVLAYRKVSDAELRRSIGYFRTTKQGRRLKKNSTYTIISIIGARDRV